MINQCLRDHANLAMLEFLTIKTALFINDPAAPEARATTDVDSIVDVVSLTEYYHLEKELTQLGFKKAMQDSIICPWHYDDLITVDEIKKSSINLRKYLKNEFSQLLLDKNFHAALPGHLNYGPFAQKRTDKVLEKIQNIVEIECEP